MSNHPLNNVLILCIKDNKEDLASFIRNHKMVNTITIVSTDLTEDYYYGIENDKFVHADKFFIDKHISELEFKCRYITLEQAIKEFGETSVTITMYDTPKSFPRIMWVKMNNKSNNWQRAMVIAFARGKYITWRNYNNLETLSDYLLDFPTEAFATDWYDIAVEEDIVKSITKEEIAKMLNITVEHLIIK